MDKLYANSLYDAKQVAIADLKVPKSKAHLVAIEPAYHNHFDYQCAGWIAFYGGKKVLIYKGDEA
jgi:hypothetical protein